MKSEINDLAPAIDRFKSFNLVSYMYVVVSHLTAKHLTLLFGCSRHPAVDVNGIKFFNRDDASCKLN